MHLDFQVKYELRLAVYNVIRQKRTICKRDITRVERFLLRRRILINRKNIGDMIDYYEISIAVAATRR